ncbi:hypothetical protein [Cellulomonas dongxiuzhuiae]|uniref:Uncharacterized protein n=1 Tax=Cellulomonas dongxiuzhuiae TaxID=2819979 RepID=A0ABX8GJY6_9CELL|nr:hypothetical protein [Cellulomonas dongxiuzhuiae]MBO3089283.1 hypothetical protein [Cellulomonas dongxiuzhuiae]MBO3094932.1 hypothetical protein [Cellulomonas dongxiuzhuiae]QWC15956.1 hypothetical protein KKR89_17180 [Cellulomonas dongxiuzhuiae]
MHRTTRGPVRTTREPRRTPPWDRTAELERLRRDRLLAEAQLRARVL